jgi:aspartate/methionine/tyrosine aminotransferase
VLFGFPNLLSYIHNRKLKKMAKEVNIVVLCDEIYQGLKAKGCGMSPVEALEKTDLGTDKSFNGTFVNIVFDALEKAKR